MKTLIIRSVFPLNAKGERQKPVNFPGHSNEMVQAFGDTMYPSGYEIEVNTFDIYDSLTGAIEEIVKPRRCGKTPPCGVAINDTEKFCPWCAHLDSVARKDKK